MNKNGLLYEGKAKKIYQTDDQDVLWIEYKDDATAFNGEKKDKIAGKSRLNNLITSQIFQSLKEAGINNHFIENLSDTEQLVRKVTIIPLEVVVRNVAAGSLSKRLGLEEGIQLNTTIVELYYKDDALGDPLINEDHIRLLDIASPEQLEIMKTNALKVNEFLLELFKEINVRLVDFKLEFGVTESGEVLLADEISPDTCRLWDMETNQKFDKDLFRRNLGSLTEGYEEILTRLGGTSNV
ncbi:phosphoribosylaminoimidazolesuccinocarboxamide synthase [Anaerobacillus alkalilacustris]|uniref:Phosphoribosylaminoimidazole-succinocarboxamide synthase n=1 Tax=Anaerobacillus alkalilacustris TaxID=393763 RepID=A0A1S2LMC7_9BACI|nr:phosphoribosylaminoimidazolesuccinocarboxamide synthase [Anaerobacillus alkalilacustris]OIJ13676.1 phosphoribosylaminoimidazolesuccinocarboxamide synthase [Anaerobacillus alkalilacustris]OIJ13688.1 phosphoribosylaminoimidazolesuccinocarboxamide synthase [Anaerobacillus alkalilacustris]